ncbi:hypothetical protein SUGI_1053220 [Cryptomeria japonica]|uniref:transcription initiation factor TFIID subunit 2 isoform X2 n=1 Tax=Cryptomeria japonica TaxID=3369 RepID=UPI0024148055|nr:transcription initiation factor TFIID subunit 2 isoform X2 [Cryptomeria japonica]GLJ49640.1 hypothetical protein SUGI_1053220 [Cryptomeria japonica]
MAKPKKQKNEEQKGAGTSNSTSATTSYVLVRHQKLCLAIDMDNQRIYGHTELKVVVPENGIIGLYANGMNIDNIFVNGLPVHFTLCPQHVYSKEERKWLSITCIDAAEAAGSVYFSSLEREMAPDLLINCFISLSSENGIHNLVDTEEVGKIESNHNDANSISQQENVRLVRIEYWLEKPEVGVHFMGSTLHTNNQIRRARCWFPCVDCSLQRCCFDLEFTVDSKYVAISNGTLLYQVIGKDDPRSKTYVYCVNIPVNPQFITLAVAPFEVHPDRHNVTISHMSMPSNLLKLQCTVNFFHNVFSYYEEYLEAPFPFGSYKQVFIDSEVASASSFVGASMSIFSSHILFDERVIDQVISTRIKLAHALARQWFGIFITPETATDGWLLDGLAGFLTDIFIKRYLGNNEARYRRYKANEEVCKADVEGSTALCSSAAAADLYETQTIGVLGKLRSWKAVAILQMLEKQMGPENFRKILQRIIHKAQDITHTSRTLGTKEFRHFANKIGNLERPFLKEFFPRWVESFGCPVLRMGLSYNKRRNMIELAVLRGCTSNTRFLPEVTGGTVSSKLQTGDIGWPGMMSVRVYELDGMYDHPSLPMAGDTCQLLEIQCHSKLAARRIQRPKKGSKADGSDDNLEAAATIDSRSGLESPLLWLRADPEMEYLAEINIHQPLQMWINQLERDKDIVAQLQAIDTLCTFPQFSFAIVNALNNCLMDSKVFWRVRIESAFALAKTAREETDWAGLTYLIKFYKSRRFDPDIGLPRPNDFRDFPEYFVLEAIPIAIAMVRGCDGKSPPEAVDFILQLLKYNDNSGNPYSDVYWLAGLVDSIGKIDFGQRSIHALPPLLKRIDRLLQFERLMPSYNGVLTVSCIRTLTQIALKLSHFVPLEDLEELIKPFQYANMQWRVRLEAAKAFINLEAHKNGLDVALSLAMRFIENEPSLRVQAKVLMHCLYLCQVKKDSENSINCSTLASLLYLLESYKAFVNVTLRHQTFCILQILAGRSPTLYHIPKPKILPISAKSRDAKVRDEQNVEISAKSIDAEVLGEQRAKPGMMKIRFSRPHVSDEEQAHLNSVAFNSSEVVKEADTTISSSSGGHERKLPALKVRIKPPEAVEDVGNLIGITPVGGLDQRMPAVCPVASSSVSVDAGLGVAAVLERSPCTPGGQAVEAVAGEQNVCLTKEVAPRLCLNGSQINASTSSVKDFQDSRTANELQCTADSMNAVYVPNCSMSTAKKRENSGGRSMDVVDLQHNRYVSVSGEDCEDRSEQNGSHQRDLESHQLIGQSALLTAEASAEKSERQEGNRKSRKDKEEKKDKKRKRVDKDQKHGADGHHKHDDPEYLERKRRKKEKRRQEKEQLRLQKMMVKEWSADLQKPECSSMQRRSEPTEANSLQRISETMETSSVQSRMETTDVSSVQKVRIKIRNRGSSNC